MNADDYVSSTELFFEAETRIAIGMLWQETNSFNTIATTADDFVIDRGTDLLGAYEEADNALGGIIRKVRKLRGIPVPVMAAKARPGGPIDDAVIENLIEEIIAGFVDAKPAAICLELHGSMTGRSIDDVEGLLLSGLRAAIGSTIPICVALDLHGHCTDAMVDSADFLTAYRTHPHHDMAETGERAAAMLAAIMTVGVRPIAQRVPRSFLALSNDETKQAPMMSVRTGAQALAEYKDPSFLDLSIFNVHPFLDIAGMGQVALAYSDRDADLSFAVAKWTADALWALRKQFSETWPEMSAVFAQIADGSSVGTRFAVGDQGDSVLAGTPGDSVDAAIAQIQSYPDLTGLVPVFDPLVVQQFQSATPGAVMDTELGGKFTPGVKVLSGRMTLERVTDGRFRNSGKYMKGLLNDLGRTVVLRFDRTVFVVTSKAPGVCDPALISHAGYSSSDFDYLVAKSGNHFKLSFSDDWVCLVAPSPGLSSRNPAHLMHRKARPIFPLDEAAAPINASNTSIT